MTKTLAAKKRRDVEVRPWIAATLAIVCPWARQIARQIDRRKSKWLPSGLRPNLSICLVCLRRHRWAHGVADGMGQAGIGAFPDRCDRWTDASILPVVFNVLHGS